MSSNAYPAAYRKPPNRRPAGRGYQNDRLGPQAERKAFMAPPLPLLPAAPAMAAPLMTAAQRQAASLGLKMAGKMAARFMPWFAIALMAYELVDHVAQLVPRKKFVGGTQKYLTLGVKDANRPTEQEKTVPYGLSGSSGGYLLSWYAPCDYGTIVTKSYQLFGYPEEWATRVEEHALVDIAPGGPVSAPYPDVIPMMPVWFWPANPALVELPGQMKVPQRPLPWALIPYRAPDFRAPSESSQRGPEPAQEAEKQIATYPNINLTPGKPPTESPATWKRQPREKEKKMRASGGMKRAIAISFDAMNKVTEFGDFLDALFDAVPHNPKSRKDRMERARAAREGMDGRFAYVLRHFRDIDATQAVKNVIANQIEDYVIGKVSKFGNKVAPGISPVFTEWTKINRIIKATQSYSVP